MIDLNPLVSSRTWLSTPPPWSPESERSASYEWFALTDRLCGCCCSVGYTASFHDEPMALATHSFAPLGLEIRGFWEVVDGEKGGLAIRETVDFTSGRLIASFVEGMLRRAHANRHRKTRFS
ncbi:hypothetical protein CDD80_136 [Ophiocordyceps camponoti-rufipedis]|uniref:DUF7053 domain-containing protein n=1 Tax=Ophiocordyceps camponoti-rufipedis TaxID=2004952 RepID=A0A2C5YLT6_9HYPO|nr:hypothetical protein CDD80_136 [Ophiocordyceps camponoti-rufipedis]